MIKYNNKFLKKVKERILFQRILNFKEETEDMQKYLNLVDTSKIKNDEDLKFVIKGALKAKDNYKNEGEDKEEDYYALADWISKNVKK